jgi:hypothetical protein
MNESKWHSGWEQCSYARKEDDALSARFTSSTVESKPRVRLSLPRHHLHRPNTDMESRNPFSKGFKKLKRKFAEGGRKRDGRYGNETAQEGREANPESEASQRNSRLHLEVEDVESGPSREGNDVGEEEVGRIDPPTSTPSIPHSGEPNSM